MGPIVSFLWRPLHFLVALAWMLGTAWAWDKLGWPEALLVGVGTPFFAFLIANTGDPDSDLARR